MDTTCCIIHKEEETFYIQPEIDSVEWLKKRVYAGFHTDYVIKFSNITKWTLLKLYCLSEDGKLLGFEEGYIKRDTLKGKVYIPYSVRENSKIFLLIQLPEYNASYTSQPESIIRSCKVQLKENDFDELDIPQRYKRAV